MKGKEITNQDIMRWKENGYFPVVCRLCDEVWLYHRSNYKPKMFVGWECNNCKMIARLVR